MSKQERIIHTSKRNFIIAIALLLLTNILMALTLSTLAKRNLREQIDQRMLDISNTAAYMLNGDELKLLKKEDEGTESYNRALDTLRAFQDNIQLDYIYGIRQMPDGSFTFTIDPTVEDPGEFGSPIVSTEALRSAANGVAAVAKVGSTVSYEIDSIVPDLRGYTTYTFKIGDSITVMTKETEKWQAL